MALSNQRKMTAHAELLSLGAILIGCLGSCLLAIFGTVVGALLVASPTDPHPKVWWFSVSVSHQQANLWFYVGATLLLLAWAGVGSFIRQGLVRLWVCWTAFVAWVIPLLLGPPLFSRDLYSYVAQGLLAKAGHNPYSTSPSLLRNNPVFLGIAQVWQHTPAPYGPLALLTTNGAVRMAGNSLFSQIMVMRLPEIFGLLLLMFALPRLAVRLGADPLIALWLAVLSPLSLISFVASGHNEGLMLGVLVVGILSVITERYFAGFALGATAATVKLPALGLLAFPLAQHFRRAQSDRWRLVAVALGATAVVFVVLTAATGFGWAWLSPSALSIPTQLRTLTTPSVSLGVTLASLLHVCGSHVATRSVVSVTRSLVSGCTVFVLLWLLWNVRAYNWVRLFGVALLVLAVGSPTLWPWYFTWGLCVLAATSAQRSLSLALLASLPVFLVGADGTPSLTGHAYLVVTAFTLLVLVSLVTGRRWQHLLGTREL